ncbi:MAG: hypothetical protein QM722_13575 [Piscinibacter sp.]
MIEQMMSGQIGQPAACMIENKRALSMASTSAKAGLSGRAMIDQGVRDRAMRALGVAKTPEQSTADVDNFVGNRGGSGAKAREI